MMVSVKSLISSQYAGSTNSSEYVVPIKGKTILDKLTVTNTDSTDRTITIRFVPMYLYNANGQAIQAHPHNPADPASPSKDDDEYLVVKAKSIAAGSTVDITEVKGHVMDSGEYLYMVASVAGKLVIRLSGREVTQ